MPACFPCNARVQLENSKIIQMKDLQIGDRVLTKKDTYSTIYLFTHRNLNSKNIFITLTTASGQYITLTPGHYLYVNKKVMEASEVKIGDCLETIEYNSDKVISISKEEEEGLFNPHTLSGDIMVNNIRTTTYTDALDPTLAHIMLAPARVCYSLWNHLFN